MFRGVLAAAVALFLVAGCADGKKEELFSKGMESLKKNNPRGAIVLFRSALEKDQNFFEARFQLAKAYFKVGSMERAERELEKVIRQNPAFADAHLELARVLLQRLKPDEALKEIEGLMQGAPDPEVFETAGVAYAVKGNYPAALRFLKKAFSMNDSKAETGVTLAKVYMHMASFKEARDYIEMALEKEPANRAALYVLAEIQLNQNEMDGAIETYGRIIEKYPSDTMAMFRKGVLYLKAGNYDEAMAISRSLLEAFPEKPEGHRLMGMVLFYKTDYDNAIIALQKSLAKGENEGAYYFLGLCHYYENELEQALGQFQRVLDFEPTQVQARIMVALVLLKQGRTDDAIIEIKRAIKVDEDNAFAQNVLGSAYMAKGMYEEGLEALNRAIEIDPGIVGAHIKKGLFNLSTGKLEQAETDLTTAVKVAPEVLSSRVILASYYIKTNRLEEAVKILQEGINGRNTDAVLYSLAAEAFMLDNKVSDAVSYLQMAKAANPGYFVSYFNLSALYFMRGEAEKAIKELNAVIERSPDNVRALTSLAAILETQDRDWEAFRNYTRAMQTGKAEGYAALAKYYVRNNNLETAVGVLDEGIAKNPSEVSLYELKGGILMSQKRLQEAIKTYEWLSAVNPELGFTLRVNAYTEMKKPEQALRLVRSEIEKEPERLDLMATVPWLYMLMGKKHAAVDSAERIMKDYPEAPEGYLALARVYRESRELDRAIELAGKASALHARSVKPYMMLGDLYSAKGQYDAALASYRKAEEAKAGYVPAVYRQGAVLHAMQRRQEAAAEYVRVLRLSMNHLPALNNLAYLYAEDGSNEAKALQLATRAYILAPRNGLVADTLGYVMLKNNDAQGALKVLKRALELVPDNPSIYYHFALACAESGDRTRALENVRHALALGEFPEQPQARRLLDSLNKG